MVALLIIGCTTSFGFETFILQKTENIKETSVFVIEDYSFNPLFPVEVPKLNQKIAILAENKTFKIFLKKRILLQNRDSATRRTPTTSAMNFYPTGFK